MIDSTLMHGSLGWNPGCPQGMSLNDQLGLGGMGQTQFAMPRSDPVVAHQPADPDDRLLVLRTED